MQQSPRGEIVDSLEDRKIILKFLLKKIFLIITIFQNIKCYSRRNYNEMSIVINMCVISGISIYAAHIKRDKKNIKVRS